MAKKKEPIGVVFKTGIKDGIFVINEGNGVKFVANVFTHPFTCKCCYGALLDYNHFYERGNKQFVVCHLCGAELQTKDIYDMGGNDFRPQHVVNSTGHSM